tara:strand:+ start:197 stop:409 length:213 start_codon:yes stop_codon:yes gene_type:complete
MKNPQSKAIDYLIKNQKDVNPKNKDFKTTDINILLNRVKIEKKSRSRKTITFSIFIISIVSVLSIIALSN